MITIAISLGFIGYVYKTNTIPFLPKEEPIIIVDFEETEEQKSFNTIPIKNVSVEEQFDNFYSKRPGGIIERIYSVEEYLPEAITDRFTLLDVKIVRNINNSYEICNQIPYNGKTGINIEMNENSKNVEFNVLKIISYCAAGKTDFIPYETEDYLYAWEQEHNNDFFKSEDNDNPLRDFGNYFASICMKDPAYEYNKEYAPMLTNYVENYINNYDFYCNTKAVLHTCKHEEKKYYPLEMRLNWLKATLPEKVRELIHQEKLEFCIIDKSQELIDLAGKEFMGLYCPIGSLKNTSYEGQFDHPVIFLVKGYEQYFENTVLHEIGHFVCFYSKQNTKVLLSQYLEKNSNILAYLSYDKECIQKNVGEYFANAFAYYYCDECEISKYWEKNCPELNRIVENAVANIITE